MKKSYLQTSNLTHISTQAKMHGAMRKVAKLKNKACTIYKKNGVPLVSVVYLKGQEAWEKLGVSSGFYWTDVNGDNATIAANQSLKVV